MTATPSSPTSRLRHLTHGIWPLVWPIMLSNLSVPLLGAVDTAILGHLPQPGYLGAVAVGSSIVTLVFWSLGFLRMGTTSLVARQVGAEQWHATLTLLARAAALALLLAGVLLAASAFLIPVAIHLMQPEPEIAPLAASYCQIRLWSAPATLLNYTLIGWFIGQQDTKRPLAILVITNAVNILLDWLFILGLGLNSDGAALASVCAEYTGLALALWLLRRKLLALPPVTDGSAVRRALTQWREYLPLIRVNRHLFVRTACLLGVFAFFTAQGARAGTHIVAANAILLQLLMLTSHALDGFAHAAEALCGKAAGAGQRRELLRVCLATTALGLLTAAGISLVFALGQGPILSLFTDLAPVLREANRQYPWVIALPLLALWGYQLDGIFLGIGLTRAMQYAMLGCALGVFLPLWYATAPMGNTGLWLAFSAFNLARGLAMGAVLGRYLQKQLY